MQDFDIFCNQYSHRLSLHGRLRSLKTVAPGLVNFSSNDYLNLSQHPKVIKKSADFLSRYGAGSGSARLVCGNLEIYEAIEAQIAAFKGVEAALLFSSGWQCNVSMLAALAEPDLWGTRKPLVIADKLVHNSLLMGCKAAGLELVRYRHNHLNHLESLLQQHRQRACLIVTESVFSMDGDLADIGALSALAHRYDALLYVDEAHATGLFGEGGRGLCHGHKVDIVMGTCSKALGSFGAYIGGSKALRTYLVNKAPGFIYTTALPPAVWGAISAAIALVPSLDETRARILQNAASFRQKIQMLGGDVGQSASQIVPVILGEEARTIAAQHQLQAQGLLAVAIRPPTVPLKQSRIRFTFSAAQSTDDIAQLHQHAHKLFGTQPLAMKQVIKI